MESLRGCLLISSGGLYDPNFRHTVVLVGEHNADGALGVVLNHALNVTVQERLPPLSDLVPPGDPLFRGGPVQPASAVLLAEFAQPKLADILVFGSVGFLVGALFRLAGHRAEHSQGAGVCGLLGMGAGPARGGDGRGQLDHRAGARG